MQVKIRSTTQPAKIKVIGIGGAGTLATQSLIESDLHESIDFICIHNDKKILSRSTANKRIDMSDLYESPLSESQSQEIRDSIFGADIIFLLCGQGKSFSSSFAPVVAKIAKDTGALIMAITTKPFAFEGSMAKEKAQQGIFELSRYTDAITVLPLQQLLSLPEGNRTLVSSIHTIYQVLENCVSTMIQLVAEPRFINIDMADIRTILQNGGTTYIGQGISDGEDIDNIESAFEKALTSPVVECPIDSAKRILISIKGDDNLSLTAIEGAIGKMRKRIHSDAIIKFSVDMCQEYVNKVEVNIVGSGISERAILHEGIMYNRDSRGQGLDFYDELDIPSFVRKPR